MDPCYLYAPKDEIEKAAIQLVENFRYEKYCPRILDVILKNFKFCWIEIHFSNLRFCVRDNNFIFRGVPHIANLGHGIYQDTDPDKLKVFIDTVHAASSKN